MRAKDFGALLLLAALWGGSFLFMRVVAPVIGPVLLITARVGIASAALLAYALLSGRLPVLRGHRRLFLVLDAFNGALPYTLFAAAELYLTASIASVLNATTPLFTALIAALWLRERLGAREVIGLCCGFVGVAVLVGWSPLPRSPLLLASIVAALAACCSYGVVNAYIKRTSIGLAPLQLAIGQQLGALVLLLPLAVPITALSGPLPPVSITVGLAVLGLALLSTALAYLLFFHLIVNIGPMRTSLVTYLTPVFGILWGALLLREPLRPGMALGAVIIFLSVALTSGVQIWPARRRSPVPSITEVRLE